MRPHRAGAWVRWADVQKLLLILDRLSKCWRLDESGCLVQDAPVVPRITLYYVHPKGDIYPREVGMDLGLRLTHYDFENKPHEIGYSDCFTTREAAEVAKAQRSENQ